MDRGAADLKIRIPCLGDVLVELSHIFVYLALTRKIILIKSTLKASFEQGWCTLNHPALLPRASALLLSLPIKPGSQYTTLPLIIFFTSQDCYNRNLFSDWPYFLQILHQSGCLIIIGSNKSQELSLNKKKHHNIPIISS